MPAGYDRASFVSDLSSCQRGLYAYIFAQLPDAAAADDVFQETVLQLWKKFDAGEEIRCLPALARELARFQVLTQRKRRLRSRLHFDGELMDLIVSEMPDTDDHLDRRLDAMRSCLGRLPSPGHDLLQLRYLQDSSIEQIAQSTSRSPRAVVQALYRARNALAECIERRLSREEAGK